MNQAINTNLNPRPARSIFQRVDPLAKDLCLFDSHGFIVAYTLQLSNQYPLHLIQTDLIVTPII